MFNKRKNEKMYLEAIKKVNVPNISGESYKDFKNTKYRFNKRRQILLAAAIVTLFTVSCIGNSIINKSSNKSENAFTIVAYANETEVKVEDNGKFELPSGYVDNDSFVMQGFYINSPDLKSFKVNSSTGSVSCTMMDIQDEQKFSEVMSIGDSSAISECTTGRYQGLVVKYRSDEEIKSMIKDMPQENIEDEVFDNNYEDGNSSAFFETSPKGTISQLQKSKEQSDAIPNVDVIGDCDNSLTVNQKEATNKYYINWIPQKEFLKKLCTNSIGDYSKENGCTLTIDLLFKDGSTMQKILNLSFDSEGKMIVECN